MRRDRGELRLGGARSSSPFPSVRVTTRRLLVLAARSCRCSRRRHRRQHADIGVDLLLRLVGERSRSHPRRRRRVGVAGLNSLVTGSATWGDLVGRLVLRVRSRGDRGLWPTSCVNSKVGKAPRWERIDRFQRRVLAAEEEEQRDAKYDQDADADDDAAASHCRAIRALLGSLRRSSRCGVPQGGFVVRQSASEVSRGSGRFPVTIVTKS